MLSPPLFLSSLLNFAHVHESNSRTPLSFADTAPVSAAHFFLAFPTFAAFFDTFLGIFLRAAFFRCSLGLVFDLVWTRPMLL